MEYKVKGKVRVETSIGSDAIANLLQKERKEVLLGDMNRYINSNGDIMEIDYRNDSSMLIRKATEKQIELYNALSKVIEYFKEMK